MGIRNVRTVGGKGGADARVPSDCLPWQHRYDAYQEYAFLLEDISTPDSSSNEGTCKLQAAGGTTSEGAIALSHSSLLQGVLHITNTVGVTSNNGSPEARRIQGIHMCSLAENQKNLETIFKLFDINVPSSA